MNDERVEEIYRTRAYLRRDNTLSKTELEVIAEGGKGGLRPRHRW